MNNGKELKPGPDISDQMRRTTRGFTARELTMNRRDFIKVGTSALLGAIAYGKAQRATWAGQPGISIITPELSDEVLLNPGMGFETFNSFNEDDRNKRAENYPRCSIAYFRFDWDTLEPHEGRYDFDVIDSRLEKARRNGQDLAVRFMPTRPADLDRGTPKWFTDKAAGYWYKKDGRLGWAPDHNDPYFLAKQEELVGAFGEKYNGHPNITRMDIGSVGFWGEWHMSHTEPEVPMISEGNAIKVIDMYLNHWDQTPLSMLIGYVPGLRYAVSQGTGWRADSLGDYGHFSDTWCHMFDSYPQKLNEANAWEAWKNGPVAFEPPGTMYDLDRYVPSRGGGYDAMWDTALEWHGSSFNAKSRPIYAHQVPPIERFLKLCGYRIALRRIMWPQMISAAQRHLPIAIELENTGVAPVYRDYVLGVKLAHGRWSIILKATAQVRQWLPGTHWVDEQVPLPDPLGPGNFPLSVGILDPVDLRPAIKLANRGADPDGWYPLGNVEIVA